MSCFPCFSSGEKKAKKNAAAAAAAAAAEESSPPTPVRHTEVTKKIDNIADKSPAETAAAEKEAGNGNIAAQTFTFRELATATKNFRPDCLLGEGGFGRVYKGCLEKTGQAVAVKQLDRNGLQGNKEFLVEVLMLSLLHHPNLVNLIGYCADGDQRVLVYEYMPLGSLEDHLIGIRLNKKAKLQETCIEIARSLADLSPDQKPLNWFTRMKIAYGAAQGLEYLHDKANPPVIYRDLKSSNILLDEQFNPKLSDFGLAKLGPMGDKLHVSSRVMGTYGYCAPEYARTGHLTVKSDVYSFGVVLLELITGRRAIDTTKQIHEQNLVTWAMPMFKDQKRFPELVDPLLEEDYPPKALNQAVAVAAMCLQEEASVRPLMADVVMTLSFLTTSPPEGSPAHAPAVVPPENGREVDQDKSDDDEHDESDAEESEDGDEGYIQLGSSNSRHQQES